MPPPDEAARGELLRVLASDAMRGALERHFGVRLAFRNCHRVGVFPAGASSAGRVGLSASLRVRGVQAFPCSNVDGT